MGMLKTTIGLLFRIIRGITVETNSVAIFAPSGQGSIGDQAMLEAVCNELIEVNKNPTIVYLQDWNGTSLLAKHGTIFLDSSSNLSHSFIRLFIKFESFVVIGADVLDGTYGGWMPFQWIGKLERARDAEAKVGIVNFSYSTEADPAVRDLLKRVSGFRFSPRDPVSNRRFFDSTQQTSTISADLAFLLKPALCSESAKAADRWLTSRKAAGNSILFVNLSGHTLSRMSGDGVAAMTDVLRKWLGTSSLRSVFLVPHDFRPAPTGDVEELDRLRLSLSGEFADRVAMINPPFDAWDVKALCGHADLALSGRMHLAIACLGMKVPVISVVYVGKFEGLMQHVGLAEEDLLIEIDDALDAHAILAKIETAMNNRTRLSAIIESRLETVRKLAAVNLDWV